MSQYEVVIIDDDIITLALLQEALKEFKTLAVSSPLDGLAAIGSMAEPPFLIILDVKMPEMSGFELCSKIREIVSEELTDIIFHTASSEMEERLKGYDLGANDFLVKPIEISELKQKANQMVKRAKDRRKILTDKEHDSHLMRAVLSDLTEQSLLIHFFRALPKTNSIPSLLKQITKTASDFGVKSSIQARYVVNGIEYSEVYSSEQVITELERELLDRLEHSDRIMTRGKRMFFNYSPFTQILKNMPDDPAQTGRFRDHFAIVLEAAIGQFHSIVKTDEVNLMIQELEVVQRRVDAVNQQQNQRVLHTLTELVDSVEHNIFDYGLTEQQEATLLELFRSSTDKAYAAIDNALAAENLRMVMQRLKALRELSLSNDDDSGEMIDVELF